MPAAGALSRPFRWAVALLLIGHGLIHALGPLEIWGIADIKELTGRPVIDFGPAASDLLAWLWLIPLALFFVTGIGVLTANGWWRMLAVAGVAVSQIVIFIWWTDAATGTIPNLLVVAAVVWARRERSSITGRRLRHPHPESQVEVEASSPSAMQ